MADRDAYLRSLVEAQDAIFSAQRPPREPHYSRPVQAPLFTEADHEHGCVIHYHAHARCTCGVQGGGNG